MFEDLVNFSSGALDISSAMWIFYFLFLYIFNTGIFYFFIIIMQWQHSIWLAEKCSLHFNYFWQFLFAYSLTFCILILKYSFFLVIHNFVPMVYSLFLFPFHFVMNIFIMLLIVYSLLTLFRPSWIALCSILSENSM